MTVASMATLACTPTLLASQGIGTGWFTNGSDPQSFHISVDSTVARSGQASLRVLARDDPSGFGGVTTKFATSRLGGRKVRVTAFVRTDSLEGTGAAVWVRADGATRPSLAFTTTQGRRHLGGTMPWTEVTLELDVPESTRMMYVGAFAAGRGTLWLDDVSLALVAPDPGTSGVLPLGFEPPDYLNVITPSGLRAATASPREPPRPLAPQGRDNLVAFTRLAAYVRFFYPGDLALDVNWDDFLVRGVRAVEQVPPGDGLASAFRTLFAPIAPEVVIHASHASPSAGGAAGPTHRGDTAGVVYWQHCGLGVPPVMPGALPRNVYRSVRRRVAPENGRLPATVQMERCGSSPVPDPTKPFVANLGAGVAARIPLALPAGSTSDASWRPRQPAERFSVDDRATRLAAVALLWMVPQHFYPYFDLVGTDWNAVLPRTLEEVATLDGRASFDSSLQRMVAALRDGHGHLGGTRVLFAPLDVRLGWVEERVVVLGAGDAAARQGVVRGDEVLSVDGEPVLDRLRRAESLVSGATPQWIRERALQQLVAGLPGDTAVIELRSGRDRRRTSTVRLARGVAQPADLGRPGRIEELRPGILYVDLTRINNEDFSGALPRLTAARGIVFDVRGYPDGVNTATILPHLADDTIRSARFQIPLVTYPDREGMRFVGEGWVLPPRTPRIRAATVFITDGSAISYAESTLGVVEENRLGTIVGEPTAGTNGNINRFGLPGGHVVTWTGMRVQKRDGTPHHGVGIRPAIEVRPTLRGVREGRDEVLERALATLTAPGK